MSAEENKVLVKIAAFGLVLVNGRKGKQRFEGQERKDQVDEEILRGGSSRQASRYRHAFVNSEPPDPSKCSSS
jgi:hypothetical protein